MRNRDLTFKRLQRQKPYLPLDEVEIPSYPHGPSKPQKMSKLMLIAPSLTMFVMAVGTAFLYRNYLYPIIMVTLGFTYLLVNILRQREQEKRHHEEREKIQSAFDNHLQEIIKGLERRQAQQANYLTTVYPTVGEISTWVWEDSSRLWERSAKDDDFMDLRLGTGVVAASFSIKQPKVDIPELAPPELLEAIKTTSQYQSLEDMPISVSLNQDHTMAIIGPPALREGLARSLLLQLVGNHAPIDVEIFAVYPSNKIGTWEWLKWLPHCKSLAATGPIPHLAYEPGNIRELYSGLLDILDARELKERERSAHHSLKVLFIADPELIQGETIFQRILNDGRSLNIALILLSPNPQEVHEHISARITLTNAHTAILHQNTDSRTQNFNPDLSTSALAEIIARGLAPLQLEDRQGPTGLPDEIRLLELVGNPDIAHLDLESRWLEALSNPPNLIVPLGMRHGKRPLMVDLKQSGVGPHGLIAGTTGSGKSELLLTVLMSLALNHHPHQVNFVLIDYKGGTAMNVLKDLPHTVGMVTDLDGKQTRRALVALRSEMERREKILTSYKVADIDKYHQLGITEPFPYLFIVIDEFAELREHFRDDLEDVLNEFVSVAQKGRALGVHLILAMQKPEGVVNDSIRANMKFRICLRVERSEDSRNVLGRPDAYLLPHQPPGRAYFQVGKDEQFDLFQVARIAGFYQPHANGGEKKRPVFIQEVGPDGRRISVYEMTASEAEEGQSSGRMQTEAQLIVEKAVRASEKLNLEKLRSPWPPPLSKAITLENIFRQVQDSQWDGNSWPEAQDWREVPVAMLDEPIKMQQRPLLLNPLEDGNILVIGAPGSGRTNFLLTYATSLMRLMSPQWIHLHMIDFGGHQLRAAFSAYPHIAGVYEPSELERIHRLLSSLEDELGKRKKAFAEVGAVSLSGHHRARPNSPPMPLIFTMINNFSGFYEVFQEKMVRWNRLLREGSSYGLHFALTSDRIPSGRTADLIPVRIALRLADRTWYSLILGSRPDLNTYDVHPGRGFLNTKPPTALQIAIPLDRSPEEQIAGLQDLGQRMSQAWDGIRPEPVRILGDQIALSDVLPVDVFEGWPLRNDLQTWIGLDNEALQPVLLDLTNLGSAMLIAGPPESGKSVTLTSIALSLAATHEPERMRMGFVSFRRGKRSLPAALADLPHAIGLAKSMKAFETLLSDFENKVEHRITGESKGMADQPHLALFIDDYQIIGARADAGLTGRLEQLMQQGTEAGFTLFISMPIQSLRGVGDTLIRRLKSMRSGIWLKSTERMEAQMVGLSIPIQMREKRLPPGRGFLYDPAGYQLLQIASAEIEQPEGPASEKKLTTIENWVEEIGGLAKSLDS